MGMGFDQQKTTHHFVLLKTGGRIEVTAKDAGDREDTTAIRQHLRHFSDAFAAGAIKPGATTKDAAERFAPAKTWGLKDEAELLTLEIAHGIGLSAYGYPVVNRQWSIDHPQPFEVGMTIAIEGREGERGRGGVRLEDAVVVTEDGCELIDHWPRDEILVAPGS